MIGGARRRRDEDGESQNDGNKTSHAIFPLLLDLF
jgi:hypothetical protein